MLNNIENIENKYYQTPIEDLYEGYEFELYQNGKYKKGKFPEMIHYHSELDEYEDSFMKFAHSISRTKYLDRGDIESLGWKYFEVSSSKSGIQPFEKDNFMMAFFPNGRISIMLKDVTKDEQACFYSNGQIYLGNCPSINELKRIMKLLGI